MAKSPAPLHDKEVLEAVFDHIPVMISFYEPSAISCT